MKRMNIFRSVALSVVLASSVAAQTGAQRPAGAAHAEAVRRVPAFEPVRVDKRLVDEFQKAWVLSKNGTSDREAVVLIFRTAAGSYTGRTLAITNEQAHLTFRMDPAAIAIAHTHPNHCDPAPSKDDRQLADRLRVPIITITKSGMFVYDPAAKRVRKVQDGLGWLNSSNFFYTSTQP